ncbi:sterol desaturase/sphingolipid hydroxylase (fatty acid hydroxylase superfamily) [Litorimonas taeanensis]|uniref:Sterol desaturase/sphingolipid hydroxylase (Fatty acid hydroxylase superfamily) n=1 Tax=Litorimonas taeanensis TaxID=568099 RepID=A0A420WEI9_9PROT|nr:sterol desaturase family protein [Litorimonas taeanensis]RKQ69366.1 sterol desaturase/sphingolipid hydroxylase (fatty acid hydroxylase superfamily) [Litorimonas taeanensis]
MDKIDLIRIGIFLGALILFSAAEALWPKRPRLQNRFRRWITNVGFVVIGSLSLQLLGPLIAVGIAAWASLKGWGLLNIIDAPLWLELTIAFIVLDFAIWWQHVLSHKIPILWRLHKVHHADRDLDASSGVRFHPIEIFLSMIYKCGVVCLLGPPVIAVVIFEITLNAMAIFNHANLALPRGIDSPLRKIIVTPDMHRVHHSVIWQESQKNYGFNLSIWDRLFKTYQAAPQAGQQGMALGLSDAQTNDPQYLGWSLWLPFRKYK